MTTSKSEQAAALVAPVEISLADLDSADEAKMSVVVNGKLTTWIWTFAGPGHPSAIEQSNRIGRERLHRDRDKEQARVNGRKWKAEEETLDEIQRKNVQFVVERLLGWSPVKLDGELVEFSPAAATRILEDPKKASLLQQAIEFIADEKSFTRRSATKS